MSFADTVFIENCRDILAHGVQDTEGSVRTRWPDGTPAHTVRLFGLVNRYRLDTEFPILTLRRTFWRSAVDELLWIWQKKSNNVRELSSRIWDAWADDNGSIGKAYGYQLGQKHIYAEGKFDQVDRLLYDLKHNPNSRRMITNLYNHDDLHEMRLYPCAYSLTVHVADGGLSAILHQRSQDMLVANNWNVCQYAILLHMLAAVNGLQARELLHVIADAHIYDRHVPMVKELIAREPFPAPTFQINPPVTGFYDFTADSFTLKDYRYHEFTESIPVAL